jgi:hypothetical protein
MSAKNVFRINAKILVESAVNMELELAMTIAA